MYNIQQVVTYVVVLTLTHGYNAVRVHRTGPSNSGAEDYLRRKTNKKTEGMMRIDASNNEGLRSGRGNSCMHVSTHDPAVQ